MNSAGKQVLETMVIISVNHDREGEESFHYRALLLEGDYTQYRGRCYNEYDEYPEGKEVDFWSQIFVLIYEKSGLCYAEIKPGTIYVGGTNTDVTCYLLNNQKEGRKVIHVRFEYYRPYMSLENDLEALIDLIELDRYT